MTRDRFEVRDLTPTDRAALERIAAEVVPDDALPTHAPRMFSRAATMVRMVARGLLVVVPPTLLAEVERLRAVVAYIDAHAPLADATCAEPGITLSEAARRALAEQEAIHDHV